MLNFSKEEKLDCFKLVSAIVHMGDMKFKEKKEQAEPDGKDEAGKVCCCLGNVHMKAVTRLRTCLALLSTICSTPSASRASKSATSGCARVRMPNRL